MSYLDFAELVNEMKQCGSSLCIDWGEDTDRWEVSWITSGVRYTAVGQFMQDTVRQCYEKAKTAIAKSEGQ
jgi:hypothetical protein